MNNSLIKYFRDHRGWTSLNGIKRTAFVVEGGKKSVEENLGVTPKPSQDRQK